MIDYKHLVRSSASFSVVLTSTEMFEWAVAERTDGRAAEIVSRKLFLSDVVIAEKKWYLRKVGVTHVVNASQEADAFPHEYKYLHIDIADNEDADMARYFVKCNAFIADAIAEGGVVLVHCRAGISRSATLVIAFLCGRRNMTLKDAVCWVRERRPIIWPNDGFLKQLLSQFAPDVPLGDAYRWLCGSFDKGQRALATSDVMAPRLVEESNATKEVSHVEESKETKEASYQECDTDATESQTRGSGAQDVVAIMTQAQPPLPLTLYHTASYVESTTLNVTSHDATSPPVPAVSMVAKWSHVLNAVTYDSDCAVEIAIAEARVELNKLC